MKAYLTIKAGSKSLGRLDLDLYDETVPRTVQNFSHFLKERTAGKGYLNSSFHRIISGFMAQGGDFLHSDGTGCTSIYGKNFADENFHHRHDRPGMLSMANSGKDTNGCQFFITFRPTPHLDGKHVVFGHVDLSQSESESVLEALESMQTGSNDRPTAPITIVDCGVAEEETTKGRHNSDMKVATEQDEEERKLLEGSPGRDYDELAFPEEEEEEQEPPKTKAEALKRRLRKLKLKMNQARQLNKQEVLREGERLGSLEGAAKVRKRRMVKDKKMDHAEWKAKNAKALGIAMAHGIDGKHLVEQAEASLVSILDVLASIVCSTSHLSYHIHIRKMHTKRKKRPEPIDLKCKTITIQKDSIETINATLKA